MTKIKEINAQRLVEFQHIDLGGFFYSLNGAIFKKIQLPEIDFNVINITERREWGTFDYNTQVKPIDFLTISTIPFDDEGK